jgi:hypothetical protein
VPNVPSKVGASAVPLTLSASYLVRASGLAIENDGIARAERKDDEDLVRVMTAVLSSFAVHDLYRLGGRSGLSFLAKPPKTVTQ